MRKQQSSNAASMNRPCYQVVRMLPSGGHASLSEMDFYDQGNALAAASLQNHAYQADEYRVRKYDPESNTWTFLR